MKVTFYHMNNVKHVFHKCAYNGNILQGQTVKINTLWYGVFKVLHDIDDKTLMVYLENIKP